MGEREDRIARLCAALRAIGAANGSGEEYMVALTICMGQYLKMLPEPERQRAIMTFRKAVKKVATTEPTQHGQN